MENIKDGSNILYTMQGWENSGKIWTKFAIPGHQVDRWIWDYFLGIVPPILKARGFLVGESYRHVNGIPEYLAFVKDRNCDKYYYVGIIPKEVFNRKYVTK